MLPDDFRRLALALPETEEREHHDHPDFRVGGKVFATLGPDRSWAMLKLPPEEQRRRVAEAPECWEAFPGAWGKQGCTRLVLADASDAQARDALALAWRRVAPESVLRAADDAH